MRELTVSQLVAGVLEVILVHTTRSTWYKVLYHPTMYVMGIYRGGQFYWQREKHRPEANYWQTLSDNFVSSSPSVSKIRTHNVSGDRHWLHK
jgi:hypothetical protein